MREDVTMRKAMSTIGRVTAVFALLLTMIVAAGAGPFSRASAQDASALTTRVRFVQADTSVSKVEVHINNDEKLDEFKYGSTSDWIDVNPGSMRLTVTADRAGFNYVIFDGVYPILAGNDYQFVISDALVLSSVVDRSNLGDNESRVRILQASVDLPAVNVVATGATGDLATELIYGMNSDYAVVAPGAYDIQVNAAQTGEALFTATGITLEPNMVYDLVIMGAVDNSDKPLTITSLGDGTLENVGATPEASPEATPTS